MAGVTLGNAIESPPIRPARRVAHQRQDVWSIINSAIAGSTVEPVINMGQGLFDYNPPQFVLGAAKLAMDRVECNQYSPSKGRQRLREALATTYSPLLMRDLDPETEIAITSGANEGMLSAFMGFLDHGDEVIVFEPFFDQYISNIEMAGGKVVYVPLNPPPAGHSQTTSAGEWSLDREKLESAINPKTKMIVVNTPNNPVGKIFSRQELELIAGHCIPRNIIILADEVYDKLCYTPFTRIATLSAETKRLTLTVGSVGKDFYATGWRIGFLIGTPELIQYVVRAHTRICFVSVSPLQEAAATGYEQAAELGFWEQSIALTWGKLKRFNEIWDELGLPYSIPQGGYFVLVNFAKVKIPGDYYFPPHIASRPRDFKLAWFLINELGVAAIPPSGKYKFYTDENAHAVEDYLRFGVTRTDEALEQAKQRLRALKKYM
ncbi:PLP-dependent transferase [Cadophora sp. DSE1049]|nr:PLP-dependent transferase [Cadophora sp. DSE1049]